MTLELLAAPSNKFGIWLDPSIELVSTPIPTPVLATPGMLSQDERHLLYSLARTQFSGLGKIIDGGSFLGASAVSLACGIQGNTSAIPQKSALIHAYELGFFPVLANGREHWHEFGTARFKRGDDFLPILRDNIAPFGDLIELNSGDLCSHLWHKDPIELCFIDVCKTAHLNQHVSAQFLPYLIAGKGMLVHQDFYFDRLPWLKVTMGYLEDYFEWLGHVHTSSVYRCIKPIPPEIASYDPYIHSSVDECLAYHDRTPVAGIHDMFKLRIELSKAYLLAYKSRRDDAMDLLLEIAKRYEETFAMEGYRGKYNRFRFDRVKRQIEAMKA